jgi:hypothetical protein
MFEIEDILRLATAIVPQLTALVPSRAPELRQRITALLDRNIKNERRADEILDILFENKALREWALQFLSSATGANIGAAEDLISTHRSAIVPIAPSRASPPAALPREPSSEVTPRFVNVCFTSSAGGTPISAHSTLAPDSRYYLRLDIGDLSPDSVVENAGTNPFPSKSLPASRHGHWLQVVIAASGLATERKRYDLFLPNRGASWVCKCAPNSVHSCAPQNRKRYLSIPVQVPPAAGVGTLRIAIYFRKNLIQSQLLVARIGATESVPLEKGYSSIIDYTLSGDLLGLSSFPRRDLHILSNANEDGSHRIVINADLGDAVVFNLSDGQVRTAIDEVRGALRKIHIEESGGKWGAKPLLTNRYDKNNAKKPADFLEDLRRLAPLGWLLWVSLMQDKPEERASLSTLLAEPSLIQVSRVARSGFVFPWALVYDIPLESDPKTHRTCKVLEDWPKSLALIDAKSPGCPFGAEHDLNTICPFGFWGVRHIIEQPPSMPKGRNLPSRIVCQDKRSMVVAVSLELDKALTEAHVSRLKELIVKSNLASYATRSGVRDALAAPAIEAVYFYCHGLREALASGGTPLPKLGVGANEGIAPGDIIAWDQVWSRKPDHWRKTSPLVFINGCHTAELTPEILVNFVDAFAGVYAAGVVGTEVTIHQQVANEASEMFFSHFWQGSGLGESLRSMRLALLHKGNLMGLAYTPYCSAELRLETVGS